MSDPPEPTTTTTTPRAEGEPTPEAGGSPILFDQFSRYKSCAEALEATSEPGSTVLDVGCGPFRLLGRFLPGARVTYLDPLLTGEDSGKDEEVLAGTLEELHVDGRQWDWVVAVDTLEHVDPAERARFLETFTSLARVGVILSGPFSEDEAVMRVDSRVNCTYREKTGEDYPWLEEHIRFGLPSADSTAKLLEAKGLVTISSGNGHVPWIEEFLPLVIAYLDRPEHLGVLRELSVHYNEELYRFDHLEPTYRRLLVGRRGEAPVVVDREPDSLELRERAARAWVRFRTVYVAHLSRHADELQQRVADGEARLSMERASTRAELDRLQQSAEDAASMTAQMTQRAAAAEAELVGIRSSISWKLSSPVRWLGRVLRPVLRPLRNVVGRGIERGARRIYHKLPFGERLRWQAKTAFVRCFGWFLRNTLFYHNYQSEKAWRKATGGTRISSVSGAGLPVLEPAQEGLADVFVWGVIDWFFRFQRPQQLARELARRGHRVFYLSPKLLKGDHPGITVQRPDEELLLYSVELVAPQTVTIYEGMPEGQAERGLVESVRQLLLWVRPPESWSIVDHPGWARLAWLPPNRRLIYDWMDNHHGFEGARPALVVAEEQLLEWAELTVVTSQALLNQAHERKLEPVMLRNACEFEHFRDRSAHPYVPPRGQRVIGYYGALAEWFDLELVRRIAERFPQHLLLLIGADTGGIQDGLHDLPNVEMPGEVTYAELPRYLHAIDVCLIPFRLNELTAATNPVKVYEYLAAGKPVVSTNLPELKDAGLDDLVASCADHAEFLEAVERALIDPGSSSVREQRRERARENSWTARGVRFAEAIEEVADPLVSVIVVTWNGSEVTRACLESLLADQSWPLLELIVVDNGSQDDTPEFLREFAERDPRIRLILNEDNRGFAAANNQGLEIAGGKYLVLLNNDTVVTRGWVRQLVGHFRRDPGIGLLGPITNNIGNEARVQTAYTSIEEMPAEAQAITISRAGRCFEIPVVAFFCVMVSREVYEEVGCLDEGFGMGFFEDDDYCRRVRDAGKRVVCAEDVFIHHELSASFSKIDQGERSRLFERNKRYYEEKWGTWEPHAYRDPSKPLEPTEAR